MTNMLRLDGLDGTNPMGFLAALGVTATLDRSIAQPVALAWSEGVVPRAVLHVDLGADEVLRTLMEDKSGLEGSALLAFPDGDPASDVKFEPHDLRQFLDATRGDGASAALAAALVAESVLDNNGRAKPTDLHFTAGQQRFLDVVRELQAGVTEADLAEALYGPWTYGSTLKSFMWDSTDDRDHALSGTDPAASKKTTVPGADWLAFRGLELLPVMPGRSRVLTPGCGGGWKSGTFTWPLWTVPATAPVIRSLMQLVPRQRLTADDEQSLGRRGVHRLLRSGITRSEQGGYGTFRPAELIWSAAMSQLSREAAGEGVDRAR